MRARAMHAAFRTYVKPSRFVVEELYENQRGSGLVGPRSFSAHGTYYYYACTALTYAPLRAVLQVAHRVCGGWGHAQR